MRQKAVVCLAAVLTTGWTGSLAATPPTDPRVVTSEKKRVDPGEAATWEITEREFLAPLLEASSLAVLSLSKEVGALQAELALARIVEQPELDAAREDLGNEGTETEMTLSWRPPRPDRKRLEVEAASERLTGADASFERSLLELQLELRRIYADWAIATARLDILDTEAALLGEMTVRLRKRAEVGEASGLQARRLGLAELDARARAALGRSDLGVILGEVGAWRPDLIQSRAAVRPVLPELNQAPETDAGPHPEVAALEAELRAAELSVEMADKVATMPSFVVGWKRVELAGASRDGPIFGMSWPVPLFGKGRAERRRAEAQRDALSAQLELLRRNLDSRRRSVHDAYEELRRASSTADRALADADPAVAAAHASFRLGESDLTTLLDTVRAATTARLAALELRTRALARQRDVARVRGRAFIDSGRVHQTSDSMEPRRSPQ